MKKLDKKPAKRLSVLKVSQHLRQKNVVQYIIAFAVIGSLILILTKAATTSVSLEPENGSGNAFIGNDPSASGGQFVQFKAASTSNNAANRLVMWHINETYTDADLQTLKNMGVGGIVLDLGHPAYFVNMGGSSAWTGDASNPLTDPGYALQKTLKTNNLVGRAHALGIKVYFRQLLNNTANHDTPLCLWSDDNCWDNIALPQFKDIAGAVKLLGGDGISFDGEGYGQPGPSPAHPNGWGWSWYNVPTCPWSLSAPHPPCEATIRAQAKQRGNQIMAAMLQSYPGLDLSMYYANMPESWATLVQIKQNGLPPDRAYEGMMDNFFDGLTSAEGYSKIRILDAGFYKGCDISGCTWDNSNQFDANSLMAYWSRFFTDWKYAASRISISPFVWIDSDVANEGGGTRAKVPGSVPCKPTDDQKTLSCQLTYYRQWAMEGEINDYAYSNPVYGPYDADFLAQCKIYMGTDCGTPPKPNPYTPWKPVMVTNSLPGNVDSTAPSLTITNPSGSSVSTTSNTYALTGHATDDYAIRYVSWTNSRGGAGAFPMTWQVSRGSTSASTFPATWDVMVGDSNYTWQMNWSANIPLQTGANVITITAADIHGLITSKTVTINR